MRWLIFVLILTFSLNLTAQEELYSRTTSVVKSCARLAGGTRSPLTKDQVQRVVEAVRLTFPVLRKDKRILTKVWQALNEKNGLPSVGFCSAATNAIYHMLGGKAAGLTGVQATYFDPELLRVDPASKGKASHWWLRDADGQIIDGTSDQYTFFGKTPPYHLGVGMGFNRPLTEPTIRGAIVMSVATAILKEQGFQSNGLP
ncbi:MAG: hypothetical protein K2X47_08515 [Bdellovibrionales bacterium]|nr:hypothetical protein [Bdellovibrionales bacterium]